MSPRVAPGRCGEHGIHVLPARKFGERGLPRLLLNLVGVAVNVVYQQANPNPPDISAHDLVPGAPPLASAVTGPTCLRLLYSGRAISAAAVALPRSDQSATRTRC